MDVTATELASVLQIASKDGRGSFRETWTRRHMAEPGSQASWCAC